MAIAAFDKRVRESAEFTSIRRTVDDVIQQAAHLAHKARVLKTIAADEVEERIVETAHRIRKNPFKSVGIAFAIGVPVGALLGWVLSHSREGASGPGSL